MKKKLIHRIGAIVCALVVAVSCVVGSVPYYADVSVSLPDVESAYVQYEECRTTNYVICEYSNCFVLITSPKFIYHDQSGETEYYYTSSYNTSYYTTTWVLDDNGNWSRYSYVRSSYSLSTHLDGVFKNYYDLDITDFVLNIIYSSCDILGDNTDNVYLSSGWQEGYNVDNVGGVYNSSLGYIKDVKRQSLYLNDSVFALVEDSLKYQFTFADTSTTGYNIVGDDWKLRHYMQIEIKHAEKEYETVKLYDKVYMGEYATSDLKVGYMYKDSLDKLYTESGFSGLSWWDSAIGHVVFINDYFQLVRTNDDGSIECGGYVKVWQDEYNINHSATLDNEENEDSGGYNDNIVEGSHGCGDTYEEAEHESSENESNNSSDLDEFEFALNDFISTIGAIPKVIGVIFSFLPPWCLGVFGLSFSFLCLLIVVKFLRG